MRGPAPQGSGPLGTLGFRAFGVCLVFGLGIEGLWGLRFKGFGLCGRQFQTGVGARRGVRVVAF